MQQLHRRKGMQINNTVYTSKEKNEQFSFKKNLPPQNRVPHLMTFIRNLMAICKWNIV